MTIRNFWDDFFVCALRRPASLFSDYPLPNPPSENDVKLGLRKLREYLLSLEYPLPLDHAKDVFEGLELNDPESEPEFVQPEEEPEESEPSSESECEIDVPSPDDDDYQTGDELRHATMGKKKMKYTDPPVKRSKDSPQPSTSKAKPPKVTRKRTKTRVKVDRAERPKTRAMPSVPVQLEEIPPAQDMDASIESDMSDLNLNPPELDVGNFLELEYSDEGEVNVGPSAPLDLSQPPVQDVEPVNDEGDSDATENSGPEYYNIINGKYVCKFPECGQKFRIESKVKEHLRVLHKTEWCRNCDRFYKRKYFPKHLKICGVPSARVLDGKRCELCNLDFETSRAKTNHVWNTDVHGSKCDKCETLLTKKKAKTHRC